LKPSAAAFLALALATTTLTAPTSVFASTLVVGNKGDNTISLIHFESGEERARLDTGVQPHEVAISASGAQAAVVAYGGQSIDIIDIANARTVETIDLPQGARPHGIVWLDDGRLVVTAEGVGAVIIISEDRETQIVAPTGQLRPHLVAVAPDKARAFVTNVNSGIVSVIDLNDGGILAELSAGNAPEGLALSPDGATLWVAERDGDRVRVFDTQTLQLRGEVEVETSERPIRIIVTADGRSAITANFVSGDLTVIDTETLTIRRTIPVSEAPGANLVTLARGLTGNRILVAETGINQVAEVDVDAGTVIRRIPSGERGDGLGLSPIDVTPGG
jgi:YVTN family beta-propeller protein